jgi:hypothetical protein
MDEQSFLAGVLVGFQESGEGFNGEYQHPRYGDPGDEWWSQYIAQSYICGWVYDWRAAVDWAREASHG